MMWVACQNTLTRWSVLSGNDATPTKPFQPVRHGHPSSNVQPPRGTRKLRRDSRRVIIREICRAYAILLAFSNNEETPVKTDADSVPTSHARWSTNSKGITVAGLLLVLLSAFSASNHPKPPVTRTDNVKETLHGEEIVDPYRWLEDQESQETREWIDSQNRYTQSILSTFPGRELLKQRLTELLKTESVSMPVERGGRYFYSKRRADQDLSVLYVRHGREEAEDVLVDPHPMSADKTVSVSLSDVSLDGTLIGFSVRRGGEDEAEVRWLNVETRQELPDTLPRARYFGGALKPDKSGFYYCRHGKEGSRVFYHAMGADFASDTELFGKGYSSDKGIGVELS